MIQGIVFTTQEAPGAIRNARRIEKVNSEPGDAHPDGTKGRVLGSIGPFYDARLPSPYAYFVDWDDMPGVPVAIAGHRIRETSWSEP